MARILGFAATIALLVTPAPSPAAASVTASAADSTEWLLFASGRTGEGDLYGVNPRSGEIERVFGTPAPEGAPRYDPARDRVVHHRYDDEGAMLMAGSIELFLDPNGDVAPAWSPNGTLVYAIENAEGADLFLADEEGRNVRRITDDESIERYPAWSPDGGAVVYAKQLDTGWDLFRIDVGTLPLGEILGVVPDPDDPVDAPGRGLPEEVRLTFEGRYLGHPAWSPDGTRIAYDTLIDGQAEIVVLDLETGSVERITHREGNDLVPAWSADGERLAFGSDAAGGNWDVWVYDFETARLERVTTDPGAAGRHSDQGGQSSPTRPSIFPSSLESSTGFVSKSSQPASSAFS